MHRLQQLPRILQIALGIILTGWIGLGLFFLSFVFTGFASFWHVAVWLSYLFLLLVVALLGTGMLKVMELLIALHRPWAEGMAERKREIAQSRPRLGTFLKIGMGITLGTLGLVGILTWSLFLPMIIECRVFQQCTPSVLE